MKIFILIEKRLILVDIHLIQNFMMWKNNIIGKMKDETKLASVAEFVGLKSKMCSYIKKIEKIEISENVVKNMAR